MNNAQFKLECFKNGLYSREQVIDFYNRIYVENKKYDKRDVQLWMNGKSERPYIIDQTAIDMINMLNQIRAEMIINENERISRGYPRYTMLFKTEENLWNVFRELVNLPLNFYHSVLIEMQILDLDYFENVRQLKTGYSEFHNEFAEQSVYFAN